MKAMVLHAINNFTLDDIEKPVPKGDQLLLKVAACGICGSDIPRVYELGTRVYPVVIGHEFSGEVCEVGDEKNRGLIGKRGVVFPLIPCMKCDNCRTGNYAECTNYNYLGSRCDGGFAEYCLIPSPWHLVQSHNPNVSLEDLSLVEPATVAQHAVRRGGVTAGSNVVIFGAGPIGIMAARWCKIFGAARVILVDIVDEKIRFARERGLEIIDSTKEDCAARVHEMTDGRGADIALEGTGTSNGLNTAVESLRAFGHISLFGNPHKDTTIKLASHSNILRKELEISGVWNSYYLDVPVNEWKFTVSMIDQGKLQVSDLISHRASLKNVKKLFDQIHNHEITICKAIYSAALN